MARPRTNLHQKIREILAHSDPLPLEANAPFSHYQRSSKDFWGLLEYLEGHLDQRNVKPAVRRRHMGRFHGMLVVHFVETFERYLKEVAAVCVDALARNVLDDRFNTFRLQGSALAAHFGTDTLGRSLCEASTWLDCDEINDRFRRLLTLPFESGTFLLFPRQPSAERERYETLSIVWQLRHTIVHNVGVVTQSDAIKLRLLVRGPVARMRVLVPTRDDLRYLLRFLDEMVELCNQRIGKQLADVLTALHAADPTLFVPQEVANQLTALFGFVLTVAGVAGILTS
jgi:hypothetical protein